MSAKPYHVGTKRQITTFLNPTRSDIYQRLALFGPLSARQIAEAIELPVTALYHHLKYLLRVGLIVAIEEPRVGKSSGRPALVYDAIGRVVKLSAEIDKPGHGDLVSRAARSAAVQASRDFEASVGRPLSEFEGRLKNIGFFRTLFSPSPQKLARVNALLDELRELTSAPDDKSGQLMTIAWFTSPVIRGRKKKKRSGRK